MKNDRVCEIEGGTECVVAQWLMHTVTDPMFGS